MYPFESARNFIPSSTDAVSPSSIGAGGTTEASQTEQGHDFVPPIVTATPAEGVSTLPVSSKPRLRIVVGPDPETVHANDQVVVPDAARHVVPPSVDTSTPETIPPPVSEEVPLIVMVDPAATVAPLIGEVIVDVGATASVEAVVATSPLWSVPGWTPISANRL